MCLSGKSLCWVWPHSLHLYCTSLGKWHHGQMGIDLMVPSPESPASCLCLRTSPPQQIKSQIPAAEVVRRGVWALQVLPIRGDTEVKPCSSCGPNSPGVWLGFAIFCSLSDSYGPFFFNTR